MLLLTRCPCRAALVHSTSSAPPAVWSQVPEANPDRPVLSPPMTVDLHAHSSASDGTEPPGEVMRIAARADLAAVALTDHDTLEGLAEAQIVADGVGVELIPGTEISCEWPQGTMHMVILFLESGPGPLQDWLWDLQASRSRRNEVIVERLVELGMDISYDEILREAGEGSVGRPHFAAVMERKGYVSDFRAAFDDYLAEGRPAYVNRERLSPQESIELALASRAVPVIAHPHTLGLNTAAEFGDAYQQLAEWGLVGIECFYGEYDRTVQYALADAITAFDLLPSGGSDFHGDYKAGLELGFGRGQLAVPDSVLEDLRAARPGAAP